MIPGVEGKTFIVQVCFLFCLLPCEYSVSISRLMIENNIIVTLNCWGIIARILGLGEECILVTNLASLLMCVCVLRGLGTLVCTRAATCTERERS